MSRGPETAAELNERATRELREQAREMRERFIRDCFDTTSLALRIQDREHDLLSVDLSTPEADKLYRFFVLEDEIHLPWNGTESQHSLTVLLCTPNTQASASRGLVIYLPRPEAVTTDEHSDISELEMPIFVLVREIDEHGIDAWHIITSDGIVAYIPEATSGEELRGDDMLDDDITKEQALAAYEALRLDKVESGTSQIARLHELLVESTLMVQRTVQGGVITERIEIS